MGNQQGHQLGDEPTTFTPQSERGGNGSQGGDLHNFDHEFNGFLHSTNGKICRDTFGVFTFAKKPITVTCKGSSAKIIEEEELSGTKELDVLYEQITAVTWDHANSEVKVELEAEEGDDANFFILTMENSIEFEGELKLRFSSNRTARPPSTMYIGMFAGSTKPRPFQRKRPNLSKLPSGKLPSLQDMRSLAISLQNSSYKPTSPDSSRRIALGIYLSIYLLYI
jgi:hypothetical protein